MTVTAPANAEALLDDPRLVKYFPLTQGVLFKKQIGDGQGRRRRHLRPATAARPSAWWVSPGAASRRVSSALLRLDEPTAGAGVLRGPRHLRAEQATSSGRCDASIQIIFQDPYASLNPRMTVGRHHRRALRDPHRRGCRKEERRKGAHDLLERVGLNPDHENRYPHQFSGGQRQRIGIARALALQPRDHHLRRAGVGPRRVGPGAGREPAGGPPGSEFGLSYIFIAHDLSVVRHISDRVAVMYLGRIVEIGDEAQIYRSPTHPYTQALLSAVPVPDPEVRGQRKRILLTGDVPSPIDPPSGCHFHNRCPRTKVLAQEQGQSQPWMPACAEDDPVLLPQPGGQVAACHYPLESRTIDVAPDTAPVS